MLILMFLMSVVFAQEPDAAITVNGERGDFQLIQIFVDITEVHAPDGSVGTSMPLNMMIFEEAQKTSVLDSRLQYLAAHNVWNGEINVYDWRNIKYMPTYSKCNYKDAVACGIKNLHWTLRTIVTVGDKYSLFNTILYDEKGQIIASDSQTAWGTIRWIPRWKLTKIKQQTMFGPQTTEIFEQWPPQMKEIPPLITPRIISQSIYGFYHVKKSACRLNYCRK